MKKIFTYILITIALLGVGGCFFDKQNAKSNAVGVVEKQTVAQMLSKYNTEIFDNSGLDPANIESLNEDNGMYSYNITEGIYLVILPLDEKKNKEEDIVNSMRIYVKKEFSEDPQVLAYARMLITANNEKITSTEAQNLIDEAISLSSKRITSNNGKGIFVGYIEAQDHDEYQVIRNYKM